MTSGERRPDAGRPSLGAIGSWARGHRQKLDEVRSWGVSVSVADADILEVARLLDAMQAERVQRVGRAADAQGPAREDEATRREREMIAEDVKGYGLSRAEERRIVTELMAARRRRTEVSSKVEEDSLSTTALIRSLYKPGDKFTVDDVVETLSLNGVSISRNAVTTALSRGSPRYFRRLERGIYCLALTSPDHGANDPPSPEIDAEGVMNAVSDLRKESVEADGG